MPCIKTPLITDWVFISGAPVADTGCGVVWLSNTPASWLNRACMEWIDFDDVTSMQLDENTSTGLLNTVL